MSEPVYVVEMVERRTSDPDKVVRVVYKEDGVIVHDEFESYHGARIIIEILETDPEFATTELVIDDRLARSIRLFGGTR